MPGWGDIDKHNSPCQRDYLIIMESYVMILGIILCLLASGDRTESGRIKRQDSADYQDVGLAFFTVDSKPSQEINIGNNHFVGNSLTDSNKPTEEPEPSFDSNQFAKLVDNTFGTNSFSSNTFGVEQVSTFSLEAFNNNPQPRPRPRKSDSIIPGRPGIDYPMFHKVPPTNFKCSDTPAVPGMYANIETGCQVYHVCHDGRDGPQGAAFLCTNGTLFNQKEFICDWWYNVDCGLSLLYYGLNLDPLKNPYTKIERERELRAFHELQFNQFNRQQ